MNINHNSITKIIIKFLKGELKEPSERQQLESWLEANSRNRQFMDELRDYSENDDTKIDEDLRQIRKFDDSEGWKRINQLRSQSKACLSGFWYRTAVILISVFSVSALIYQFWWKTSLQVKDQKIVVDKTGVYQNDVLPADTAAQLILADGSVFALRNTDVTIHDGAVHVNGSEDVILNEDMHSKSMVYNTLSVPRAAFFKIMLPDGTKVWLNAMSQLHFPAKFPHKERRVVLEGEGYFEVAKDAERPFFVEASGTSIRVLGTHFNVNSYKGRTRTTLVEGSVEVRYGEKGAILKPGEEADVFSSRIQIMEADVEKATSWKNGEFYFHGDNIATIMSQLGRWYDLEIKLSKSVDPDIHYTGSISRKSTLGEVLAMLTHVSSLHFDLNGRQLIIH